MRIVHDEKIQSGGDDLGTIWYTFTGMTLEQAVDWIKRKGLDRYRVSCISSRRKYLFFGTRTIQVIFDLIEQEEDLTYEQVL